MPGEELFRGEVLCGLCGKVLAEATNVPESACHRAAVAAQERFFCAGHTQSFNVNVRWSRVQASEPPLPPPAPIEPVSGVSGDFPLGQGNAIDEARKPLAPKPQVQRRPRAIDFGDHRCRAIDADGDPCILHAGHDEGDLPIPHNDGTGQWIDASDPSRSRVHAELRRCETRRSGERQTRCVLPLGHTGACDFGPDLSGVPELPSLEPPPEPHESSRSVNGQASELHS